MSHTDATSSILAPTTSTILHRPSTDQRSTKDKQQQNQNLNRQLKLLVMIEERVQQAVDANNGVLKTTLHKFAGSGDAEAITALLQANPDLDINISSKGKNTALHSALSHNQQGLVIDCLISYGANVMAFNTKGFNPLVLAIIHCQNGTQALEKLIKAGVDCTSAFGRGKFSGLSPMDLAIQSNNEQAKTLLENMQLKQKAVIDEKPPSQKKNHGTCPLCRCCVKFPTKMSFILSQQEDAEKKERERLILQQDQIIESKRTHDPKQLMKKLYTSRKYLDQFLTHSGGSAYEKLCRIEYHGIGNKNKLRKEITESYSILHAVEQCCDDLRNIDTSDRSETDSVIQLEQVFVIDLCSGKSLTTALCCALFPSEQSEPGYGNNHFLAVDRLPVHLIPHFLQDANSSYLSRDIMIPEFFAELEQEVRRHTIEGRTAILVGMHLCGNLSERAIELFRRIPLIKALVLSPCCLPKLRKGVTVFDLFEKNIGEDPYFAWSRYLEERINEDMTNEETMNEESKGTNVAVRSYFDTYMHSIKNTIITAVKHWNHR
jgi:hypothetical protein